MKITITGRVPSKKNSKQIIPYRGRYIIVPSSDYKKWHKTAAAQVNDLNLVQVEHVDRMTLNFYAPDRRATDLTNKAESIMDLLVDCGVIKDDNWFVVRDIRLVLGGVDPGNPRVEVEIVCAQVAVGTLV